MNNWKTKKNKNLYKVNISNEFINCMKEKGARFCKFSDNIGIDDESSDFYKDSVYENTIKGNTSNGKTRVLKENISVVCDDGESINGYITHFVKGPCSGTNESNWFIIQPGNYPTNYIIEPHHYE